MFSMQLEKLDSSMKLIVQKQLEMLPFLEDMIDEQIETAQIKIMQLDSSKSDFGQEYANLKFEINFLNDFKSLFTIGSTLTENAENENA